MSNGIINFIKQKEGFRPDAYTDPAGIQTIGYGRTTGSFGPTTQGTEDAWLVNRVKSDRDYVQNYGEQHGYNWSDQQLDALTSFVYNLGRGGLHQLTDSGSRNNSEIAEKIPLYNKADGQTLPGLVTRRNEEAAMFSGEPGGVPQDTFRDAPRTVPHPQQSVPQSFGDTFASARAAHGGGGGTFTWNGKEYTTDYKEELNTGGMPMKDLNDPTNRDSVPAMLTPGEYVLNKEATALFGPMIEQMNQAGLQQRHAENQQVQHKNIGGWIKNLFGFGDEEDPIGDPLGEPGVQRKPGFQDALDAQEYAKRNAVNPATPHSGLSESPALSLQQQYDLTRSQLNQANKNRDFHEVKRLSEVLRQQKRELDSFKAAGIPPVDPRGQIPVGSVTDTSLHSQVAGRPDVPVGNLTDASYTGPAARGGAIDPRTGTPVGDLTDAVAPPKVAPAGAGMEEYAGSREESNYRLQQELDQILLQQNVTSRDAPGWQTLEDRKAFLLEQLGRTPTHTGSGIPNPELLGSDKLANINKRKNAEQLMREAEEDAKEALANGDKKSLAEAKAKLEKGKQDIKTVDETESKIKDQSQINRDQDYNRAVSDAKIAIKEAEGKAKAARDAGFEDIAASYESDAAAMAAQPVPEPARPATEGTHGYDTVPPVPVKLESSVEPPKETTVSDNEGNSATVTTTANGNTEVKTNTGQSAVIDPKQKKGIEDFIGGIAGDLGLGDLNIGELVGTYMLGRLLGQGHRGAGAMVLNQIQADRKAKSDLAVAQAEAKGKQGVKKTEAGNVVIQSSSGDRLPVPTRTTTLKDGTEQVQYNVNGEWLDGVAFEDYAAQTGYTIDQYRESDTPAAQNKIWNTEEDRVAEEIEDILGDEWDKSKGSSKTWARNAVNYARDSLNILNPAQSEDFHDLTLAAAKLMKRDVDAGGKANSIKHYMDIARADAYAGQSNSIWVINPNKKPDKWEFVQSDIVSDSINKPIKDLAKVEANKKFKDKATPSQIYLQEKAIYDKLWNAYNSTAGRAAIEAKYGKNIPKGHNLYSWYATSILSDSEISAEEKKKYNIKS